MEKAAALALKIHTAGAWRLDLSRALFSLEDDEAYEVVYELGKLQHTSFMSEVFRSLVWLEPDGIHSAQLEDEARRHAVAKALDRSLAGLCPLWCQTMHRTMLKVVGSPA